jgi:hypothetical protein
MAVRGNDELSKSALAHVNKFTGHWLLRSWMQVRLGLIDKQRSARPTLVDGAEESEGGASLWVRVKAVKTGDSILDGIGQVGPRR